MAVTNISAIVLAAIERKSAKYMPARAAEMGLSSETIRRYLYSALTDPTNSLYSEINRIVAEVNAELTTLAESTIEIRYNAGEIQWKYAYETEWTTIVAATEITGEKGDKGVSLRIRGDWNALTDYLNDDDYQDVVHYEGAAYYCKVSKAGNAGNGDPLTDTVTWGLYLKQGTSFRHRGEWDKDTSYYHDEDHVDVVTYLGDLYYAKTTITGTDNNNPMSDTPRWGLYSEKGISFRHLGEWDADTAYLCDSSFVDVVTYNGKAWACKLSISGTGNSIPEIDTTHWELFLDNTMAVDLDTSTTTITHMLEDNAEQSFSQATIVGVTITIPGSVGQGFISCVNYKSGASPVQVSFVNNSAYTLKLIKYGLPVSTYTPTANRTVELMFYCNGLIIECIIHEVE